MVYRSRLEFFCLRKWASSNFLIKFALVNCLYIHEEEKNDNKEI